MNAQPSKVFTEKESLSRLFKCKTESVRSAQSREITEEEHTECVQRWGEEEKWDGVE